MNLAVSQPIPSILAIDNKVITSALISSAKLLPEENIVTASATPATPLPIANPARPIPKPINAKVKAPPSFNVSNAPPCEVGIDNRVNTFCLIPSAQFSSLVNNATPACNPLDTAFAP